MSRYMPKRLGKKLAAIRKKVGADTYEKMVEKLDVKEVPIYRSTIFEYEQNKRQPPLIVLLRYAKLAKVKVEDLIDDSREI